MLTFSIRKSIETAEGTKRLSFEGQLQKGETLALFAPSGYGKTTMLRIFAGLVKPEQGLILSDETVWLDTSKAIHLPTHQRAIAFMFQEYALMPHMTVKENLLFAQRHKKDEHRVENVLAVAGLSALTHRYPHQLSGGQQQRVALMRCFVDNADVYLLDEPLSALDRKLRVQLLQWLKNTLQALHKITVLVSHDLAEVFCLADKIARFDEDAITIASPLSLLPQNLAPGSFRLTGQVIRVLPGPLNTQVQVAIGQETVMALIPSHNAARYTQGQYVEVFVNGSNVVLG